MDRPRAADDFATIRARMEELRRESDRREAGQIELQSGPVMRPRRSIYRAEVEPEAGPNRSGRSGPMRS